MNFSIVKDEGIVLSYSGLYDKTKVMSPDVIRAGDQYRLYYVGTNCPPEKRTDYRLLVACSDDGKKYTKTHKPILDLESETDKHYSPKIIYFNKRYLLYYGLGSNGKYQIAQAVSDDGYSFTKCADCVIDVSAAHKALVHSPKMFVSSGKIHCYYTGSNFPDKIYSKKYPSYEFANQFSLFYSSSFDGKHFAKGRKVHISDSSHFVNIYGHNVYYCNDLVYLFFAGFDGSTNSIYVTTSSDMIHFEKPRLLLSPNPENNELGIYSCSLVQIDKSIFRLFYGVRYFDNRWKIKSVQLRGSNL